MTARTQFLLKMSNGAHFYFIDKHQGHLKKMMTAIFSIRYLRVGLAGAKFMLRGPLSFFLIQGHLKKEDDAISQYVICARALAGANLSCVGLAGANFCYAGLARALSSCKKYIQSGHPDIYISPNTIQKFIQVL